MATNSPRLAIVTGGSSGIGRATTERLAQDGLRVLIWDLNSKAGREVADSCGAAGLDVSFEEVDVTDEAQVRNAAAAVEETTGHIDVLVNCVGGDVFGLFLESDEDRWDRIIALNFRSVLITCRYLADVISRSEHGRIVQIASDAAKVGAPLEAVYSGAKAGVIAFSRSLARELAKSGTTVNCVSPGPCDTPLLKRSTEEVAADPRYEEFFPGGLVEGQVKAIPLGRIAQPTDIANAVSFLVQPASSYITGQTLSVSGGVTVS
jgi:2-hydroxycyclohexanecarboxyl-CoA dehydrogenase